MKTVKKILTLLLIISLSILVMPNNKVLAEEDEPATPALSLLVNGDPQYDDTHPDKAKMLKCEYINGKIEYEKTGSLTPTYVQAIDGIEDISYEGGTPFGTFTIKIKDNGVVNLTSYFGCLSIGTVANAGILSSFNSNIKIIGKGTLNITMLSRENIQDSFQAVANVVYNFIDTNGDIIIGDENSKIDLNIKLDVNENDRINFDTRIIEANTITLENVNFDIKTRNNVFKVTSSDNPQPEDPQEKRNRLLIKNSEVKIENQNLNEMDTVQKRNFNVVTFMDCSGDFTVENSSLDIKCIDTSQDRSLIDNDSVFVDFSKNNSRFNLINSNISAYSNCAAIFCSVEQLKICNCSQVNITQDIPDWLAEEFVSTGTPFICFNSLNIMDSNFDFSAKGPLIELAKEIHIEDRTTPTFQSATMNLPSINIEETDSSYIGKMSTEDTYLFLRDLDLDSFQEGMFTKEEPVPIKFPKINIKSKGSYLRTSLQGSALKKNEYLINEGDIYTFGYAADATTQQEDLDLIAEKLKWNRFEISKDPESPKHIVLDTGIN